MSTETLSRPESEIVHQCRMKSYPDGSYEIMAASRPVFREDGWERNTSNKRDVSSGGTRRGWSDDELDRWAASGLPYDLDAEDARQRGENVERSMRRAATKLRDIALCNDFRWFVTLTLDPAKIDRHSMDALTRVLNRWADNRVRRRGLRYVLVPERHKDGAIHLHGFFNEALPMVDSGTIRIAGVKQPRRPRSAAERQKWLDAGGQIVYNVPDWTLGFSTALELRGDYHAAVGYVCKYVRKAQEKIGGRWYYSGGQLEKPAVSYPDVCLEELQATGEGYTFCVPGRTFCIVRGKGGDADEGDGAEGGGHF